MSAPAKTVFDTRSYKGRHTFFDLDATGARVTVDIAIAIEVNLASIAKQMARRAWANKTKASSELYGAVRLRILEDQNHD
jgi:hypothetical protein